MDCLPRGRCLKRLAVLAWILLTIYMGVTIYLSPTSDSSHIILELNNIDNNLPINYSHVSLTSHFPIHPTNGSILSPVNAKAAIVQFIINKLGTYYTVSNINRQYQQDESPRDNDRATFIPLKTPSFNVTEYDKHRTTNSLSVDARLQLAYNNKWVGFPDMDGRHCRQALFSNVNNDLFKRHVKHFKYEYSERNSKCEKFRDTYGFNRYSDVSEEEKNFPIAFIILFHNNFDQVIFLLRAIYRPHNVYCLSVDGKNSVYFITFIKSVIHCLPNAFVASKLAKIVYAGFSRLMADIYCMEDLLKHPVQWKYVINMPGQQFPLRTNLELVKILSILNGTNDIEGMPDNANIAKRYLYKHKPYMSNKTGIVRMINLRVRNTQPPYNLTMVKGSTYGSFSRSFVEFALNNSVAKSLLEYCQNVLSPDEYFWATLQHTKVVTVPGGYTGERHLKRYITSYSVWFENNYVKCSVKFVRHICVFAPGDLSNLVQQDSLFANKFYIYLNPAALHCLDEWLFNRTIYGTVRDLSGYKNLIRVED